MDISEAWLLNTSLHEDPILLPARKCITNLEVTLTLRGFCTGKVADSTASQLESALRVSKASAKVFEPRVT